MINENDYSVLIDSNKSFQEQNRIGRQLFVSLFTTGSVSSEKMTDEELKTFKDIDENLALVLSGLIERQVRNSSDEEMGSFVQISSAIALFSSVIFFMLCNIPRLILNQAEWDIRTSLHELEMCEASLEIERLFFLSLVSKLCLAINSSANVLIYYSVNRVFRLKIRMIMKYFPDHV